MLLVAVLTTTWIYNLGLSDLTTQMNSSVLSELLSFLDINLFQSCSGDIELIDSCPLKEQIKSHWLKCSNYAKETSPDFVFWTRNSVLHRDGDLPAAEHICGVRVWMKQGNIHREEGLAAIECHSIDDWWIHELFLFTKRLDSTGILSLTFRHKEYQWWQNNVKVARVDFRKHCLFIFFSFLFFMFFDCFS